MKVKIENTSYNGVLVDEEIIVELWNSKNKKLASWPLNNIKVNYNTTNFTKSININSVEITIHEDNYIIIKTTPKGGKNEHEMEK